MICCVDFDGKIELEAKTCNFWILDLGFWIGDIALGLRSQFCEVCSLYLLMKQTEYLKSKIRNPNSKIFF
jgi:hypothetical protein